MDKGREAGAGVGARRGWGRRWWEVGGGGPRARLHRVGRLEVRARLRIRAVRIAQVATPHELLMLREYELGPCPETYPRQLCRRPRQRV